MGRTGADGGTALSDNRQSDILLALALALAGTCLLLLHLTSIEQGEPDMPFVTGFLRLRRRRPGEPTHPIAPPNGNGEGGNGDVDPGYGVDVGGEPGHPIELPDPPPGIWPPPTAEHPIAPLPPTDPTPPGTIWPSPGTPTHPIAPGQKVWLVAGIPGYGWKYVCVDPSLVVPRPTPH